MSILRITKMTTGARGHRGQAAVMFVVLMALILVLAAAAMNVGEVARLKTGTANAADAGALAAASWIASGENEVAQIARGMWINIMLVQAVFAFPYCYYTCHWLPWVTFTSLMITNLMLKLQADQLMHHVYDQGKAAALMTAVQNLHIDDTSGAVQSQLAPIRSDSVPDRLPLSWVRKGAGGVEEPNSVDITLDMGPIPTLTLGVWGGAYWCWELIAPCEPYPPCCESWPAWIMSGAGSIINLPTPGPCFACFVAPMVFPIAGIARPDTINEGSVTITVAQHRAGGTNVGGFWTTRYPDQVTSRATAHYSNAQVAMWPSQSAKAELVSVQ